LPVAEIMVRLGRRWSPAEVEAAAWKLVADAAAPGRLAVNLASVPLNRATPIRLLDPDAPRLLPEPLPDHLPLPPMPGPVAEHGTLLDHICRCGARLRPFQGAEQFTCPACALGWWELLTHTAEDDTVALDARLLRLFHHFLEFGTADSIGYAMQAVVDEMAKRGLRRLPPIPREAAVPSTIWDQASVSLTRVVGALAALGLPPEAAGPPPQPRVPPARCPA
jgi:hypothetical protein